MPPHLGLNIILKGITIKTNWSSRALTTVILATLEAKIRRTMVQGLSRQIVFETPISKANTVKMDWMCGSSDKSASQMWSPELKPPSHQKKKKKELDIFCIATLLYICILF
jgi:hypothetical protein